VIEMRTPKVGDRVAIPKHAIIFVIKSVNESKETVDAQMSMEPDRIEKGISWEKITIIDP
jgi:hypothetical protein